MTQTATKYSRWTLPVKAGCRALIFVASAPLALAGCQSAGTISNVAGNDAGQGAHSLQKGSLARGARTSRAMSNGAQQNLASLNEVVRNNPQDVNALNMRGTAYARGRKWQQAMADFNAAIDMNPEYYQAYANRALVHVKLKRFNEAMNDYQRALEISPTYAVAMLGRGRLYRKNGVYARALADFRQVIKLNPSNAIAYYQRGYTYQLMGQHENAVSDFDVAIGLKPDKAQTYFARGQSRFALQQYETAYDDFYIAAKRGRKGSPGSARAWTFRGLSAERFGDPKKAVRAYRRALQNSPQFRPAIDGMKRLGAKAA